jgi:YggT family protein
MEDLLPNFIRFFLIVLWVLLLARVIMSWTNPMGGGGVVAFVYQATEPILGPIRRVLPPTSGVDWSPLIAMLVISALIRVVTNI